MWRRFGAVTFVSIFALCGATGAASAQGGPLALDGAAAAAYRLPGDVVVVRTTRLTGGRTQTRYQQRVAGADVLGGQLTIIRNATGTATAVIGAHYPALAAKNKRSLSAAEARAVAERRVGAGGRWSVATMIDAADGHLFYRVESRRADSRPVHWIDASSGAVRNAYDGLAYDGPGIGVKGDVKQLDTSVQNGTNALVSSDGRQLTYDAGNTRFFSALPGTLFTDPDDVWDLAGRTSPGQPAGVDAHYYANVTDDFYLNTLGRNSLDGNGMPMVSSAHFARNYNNAFWNGSQMTYGDGDGRNFREFSGGVDVVGHEFTHGVTEFTSNLIYENESGALNEAFSDMMGSAIEQFAASTQRDSAPADWLIAEDISLTADTEPGFRNMADPREDGDPDHYSELVITTADNGGVHTNSGIPNHAFELLVNGGRNAGCDSVGSDGHVHTADCDVSVPALGLAVARDVFYTGFTSLHETANMCDARNATVAAAPSRARSSVRAAWDAVGARSGCTGAPPPAPCGDPAATIPFESEHPYRNSQDCTWTYDHGSGGYALHFSLLDVERNFDFVTITDATGNQIARVTGTFRRGYTTPCIPTAVANVNLGTDGSVVAQGFIVDAALPCG
jgi:bacillolysin